ncbi:ShlB/FhaC/HecB family hemolysin secretion/activation protein [Campylobacter jejuni]|nr:ShlB/FhaC/HecB family hemolysin secretion/activation protein [Campylobacter jejuni]
MRKILVVLVLLQVFSHAEELNNNKIRELIESSPEANEPQNKNLKNTLKNQKSPVNFKEQNTTNITNSQTDQNEAKVFVREYVLHIDNKDLTFKKLRISEKEIQDAIAEYRNQELSLQNLKDITNIIAYYCQVSGYPSATAYIPPQDLSSNKVQINIAFGTLGKVIIKNNSGVRDYALESKLNKNLKGKVITTKNVENEIYKINEIYGIQTNANLQSGDGYGESDVIIEVNKGDSATLTLYSNNYGTKETGRFRAGMSQSLNNIARQGDNLNFYLQDSDENQIDYGINYSTFIGNLKITPFATQGHYVLGGIYRNLGFYGDSMNVGVNFSYPVFLYTEYSLYLVSGFTHKKIKDYYLDGLVSNEKASNSVNLGIEGTYKGLENNVLSYTLNFTYGNVENDGDSSGFNGVNLGNFGKMNLNLSNEYQFQERLTHIFQLNYQKVIGGAVLDSSESVSLGGPYGVRAYLEGEGGADNVVSGTLGIRFQTPLEGLYLTPFYDIGYSWYENKEYQSENHYFMDAMGMQILYTRSANFYVKMDAARAVHRFKHDGEHRARVYVSLGKYF